MKRYLSKEYEAADHIAKYHTMHMNAFIIKHPEIVAEAKEGWQKNTDTLHEQNFFGDRAITKAHEDLVRSGIDNTTFSRIFEKTFSQYVFDSASCSATLANLKSSGNDKHPFYNMLETCYEAVLMRMDITEGLSQLVADQMTFSNIEAAITKKIPQADSYKALINGSHILIEVLERIDALFKIKDKDNNRRLSEYRRFAISYIVDSHYMQTMMQNFSRHMVSRIYGQPFEPVVVADNTIDRIKRIGTEHVMQDLKGLMPQIVSAKEELKKIVDYESIKEKAAKEREISEYLYHAMHGRR